MVRRTRDAGHLAEGATRRRSRRDRPGHRGPRATPPRAAHPRGPPRRRLHHRPPPEPRPPTPRGSRHPRSRRRRRTGQLVRRRDAARSRMRDRGDDERLPPLRGLRRVPHSWPVPARWTDSHQDAVGRNRRKGPGALGDRRESGHRRPDHHRMRHRHHDRGLDSRPRTRPDCQSGNGFRYPRPARRRRSAHQQARRIRGWQPIAPRRHRRRRGTRRAPRRTQGSRLAATQSTSGARDPGPGANAVSLGDASVHRQGRVDATSW